MRNTSARVFKIVRGTESIPLFRNQRNDNFARFDQAQLFAGYFFNILHIAVKLPQYGTAVTPAVSAGVDVASSPISGRALPSVASSHHQWSCPINSGRQSPIRAFSHCGSKARAAERRWAETESVMSA